MYKAFFLYDAFFAFFDNRKKRLTKKQFKSTLVLQYTTKIIS